MALTVVYGDGMTMTTTVTERLTRDGVAYVAVDTVDAIADHILGILGTDRRLTLVSRYLYQGRDPSPPTLTINTSLRRDTGTMYPDGVQRWSTDDARGMTVWLEPGIHAFGISAYCHEAPTEAHVARRYHDRHRERRDVSVVRCQGRPGQPSRDDRIHIESWNRYGVCIDTTIAFEESPLDH